MTANKSTGDALSVQILRLLSICATSNLPTSLGIDQAQRLTVQDRREPLPPALPHGTTMSAVGQSRHFDRGPAPSGLPRSTDIVGASRHVGLVTVTDVLRFGTWRNPVSIIRRCIVQSIGRDPGNEPRRIQLNCMKSVVPWGTEQCVANRTGDKNTVFAAFQELGRRILQSRGDPDIATYRKERNV